MRGRLVATRLAWGSGATVTVTIDSPQKTLPKGSLERAGEAALGRAVEAGPSLR
jgi:hypothetical protein